MKYWLKIISISALSLGVATLANAEGFKIGFVDTAKLIEQAPQAEKSLKKLEAEFGPRDKELRNMRSNKTNLENEMVKNELVYSDEERNKKQKQLRDIQRELKRSTQEFREDYNVRRNEELGALQKVVYKAIVDIAKAEGYDLVLTEGTVYASDKADMTKKVLAKLGK